MLGAIGLSRDSNCYITGVVKCRPPDNRPPLPEETAACLPFLDRQIRILQPAYILCLGKGAAQILLGTTETISRLRGRFFDYQGLPGMEAGIRIPLLPTYHPDDCLGDENLKRPAWEDLKTLRARIAAGEAYDPEGYSSYSRASHSVTALSGENS
jgi:DNA polymerase